MKKVVFTLIMLVALIAAVSIFASAECIIDEENIDDGGEIVADFLGSYTIDGSIKDIFSLDITYQTVEGEIKDGKIYYATSIWKNGNRRQIHSTYLPSGFDLEQIIYMFDKADVNGDGDFSSSELIKGVEGGKNLYYTYEAYENGTFDGLTNVKLLLKRLVYSRYLEYMGPNAYSEVSFVGVTYSGKELEDGVCYISSRLNDFHSGAMGGEANGAINRNEPQYSRLVFEERTGVLSLSQYAFCRGTLTEIVFMPGTYRLGNEQTIAYQYHKGTNTPSLQNIVIAEGANISNGSISWNVGEYSIIYIGSHESYESQLANGDFAALKNKNDSLTLEEPCYVWGHIAEDNDYDCTTALSCKYAQNGCEYVFAQAKEHIIDTVYSYKNGFNCEGTKRVGCINDDCNHGETTIILPLFTSKGYSRDEGSNAIVLDYQVNKEAIREYEEYLGNKISYGIVASKALEIYEGSPINIDTTTKNGAFSFGFENTDYSILQLKLTNILQKDDALYLAGYFIINDTVGYMNGNNIDKCVLAISYNNYTGISKDN